MSEIQIGINPVKNEKTGEYFVNLVFSSDIFYQHVMIPVADAAMGKKVTEQISAGLKEATEGIERARLGLVIATDLPKGMK